MRACIHVCAAAWCLQVLVAVGSTVWQVDDRSATDLSLPGRAAAPGMAIHHLAVSPDGQFLAAFTHNKQQGGGAGLLSVMSAGACVKAGTALLHFCN